ncbi:Leucine-rich repeat-containing protein 38 [Tupaia chinensis]|uniref:Leucine-rich repeat-containing protein 38 n=1 Tax=Tupaia chinensis TaxID=246437 RepID=L9L092_TUPCH|nr:Leucine-rich repeat-containing protein 38 [Tupaia chinensis]
MVSASQTSDESPFRLMYVDERVLGVLQGCANPLFVFALRAVRRRMVSKLGNGAMALCTDGRSPGWHCPPAVLAAPSTPPPSPPLAGYCPSLDEIQCSLPTESRRVSLRELSEASFSECKFSLSLTDLFIIIFSGVVVSIAAIISSFFLATVVQCFQRCAPNKDTEDEDDDEDD